MKAVLLDTNVLLALAWPNHQHHAPAHAWFAAGAKKGWATCAFMKGSEMTIDVLPSFWQSSQDAAQAEITITSVP